MNKVQNQIKESNLIQYIYIYTYIYPIYLLGSIHIYTSDILTWKYIYLL